MRWSDAAKSDLRRIHEFIATDSLHYARKVTEAIRERTGLLEAFPFAGKITPELGDPEIREVSIYSYRIIYAIAAGEILILGIVHKRRDRSTGSDPA